MGLGRGITFTEEETEGDLAKIIHLESERSRPFVVSDTSLSVLSLFPFPHPLGLLVRMFLECFGFRARKAGLLLHLAGESQCTWPPHCIALEAHLSLQST